MKYSPAGKRRRSLLQHCRVGALLLPALASAQDAELNQLLDLSLEDLANIVVSTPTKNSQTLAETPAQVRVILARDIAERGYLTLEDALADLPGFQFRNIQGFNSYVFMRGVPNQNNLILLLVDGVQINELNSGGFYGGGQFNLSNVARIEVVYGPGSALYGTNAVSGVINLITREPEAGRGLQGSVLVGNFDTRQATLSHSFLDETRNLGLNVSAMLNQTDKGDLRLAEGDNNWSSALDNYEDDLALDLKLRVRNFALGINYQDKQASYATRSRRLGTLQQDYDVDWHIRFLNAWARYDYDEAEHWSWHGTLYYRDATVRDDTRPLIERATANSAGFQERWYRPNELVGAENRLDLDYWPRLALTLGLVQEHEKLAADFARSRSSSVLEPAPAPAAPPSYNNDLSSVYAQARWQLANSLSLTAGARHDDSSFYGSVFTPRLGLVWNRDQLSAKLLYTEAYRAPRPWDFNDGLGNPDLAPEEMQAVELALGYTLHQNLSLELSLYRNELSNNLTREQLPAGQRWTNRGQVDTAGAEAGLSYVGSRSRSYVNYTWTDSSDGAGAQVAEIMRNSANAGIHYAFNGRLSTDLRVQYLGKRRNPQAFGPLLDQFWIDEAFVFHGSLNLRDVQGFDVQLAARNMFDETWYHTSNTTASRYRQPQLTVTLKVSRTF